MEIKIRAFFKTDIELDNGIFFELKSVESDDIRHEEALFVCNEDPEITYPIDYVFTDPVWIVEMKIGKEDWQAISLNLT